MKAINGLVSEHGPICFLIKYSDLRQHFNETHFICELGRGLHRNGWGTVGVLGLLLLSQGSHEKEIWHEWK